MAAAPAQPEPQSYRLTGSRIAIGRSIRVDADEEVIDAVVVVGGSLRVEGRVRNGLVVVGGDIDLGPRADVRGDVVVVGGRLNREPGAQLRGSVSDVTFGQWWRNVSFGGIDVPAIHFGDLRWLPAFGAMFRITLLAVCMAFVLVLARARVARVANAAAAEPGKAFFLGLLAAVLFIPALVVASIALAVTIIGIPLVLVLIPLSIFSGVIALLLGFTAMACRLGEWLQDRVGLRAHSAVVSTALGLALIAGPTLVARMGGLTFGPFQMVGFFLLVSGALLEFVVWTTGLGASLMTGFGRWQTTPPPIPAPAAAHYVAPQRA